MRQIDIQGKKFGNLLVLAKSKKKYPNGVVRWRCQCDCGNKTDVLSMNLRAGRTKSCGCMKLKSGLEHHHAKTSIEKYGEWIAKESGWYTRAAGAIRRARKSGVFTDFESNKDLAHYLTKIAPEMCPVFNIPMVDGSRRRHKWSPSIDRIDSTKGYVKGNLQVISNFANTMKQNATKDELMKFSVWALKSIFGKNIQILVKGKTI